MQIVGDARSRDLLGDPFRKNPDMPKTNLPATMAFGSKD
jgi:hypothetical protein